MRRLGHARLWFSVAAILALLVLFVVDGAAGGVMAAAALAAFIFASFLSLRAGGPVDDRAAGTGLFG